MTLSLSVCFVLFTATLLVAIGTFSNPKYHAWAGGGIPCGLFLKFDKFVFSTETTIPIRLEDTCGYYYGKTVNVIVSSPEQGIDNNTGRAIIAGASTYLNKQTNILGKYTEVGFDSQTGDLYRFLVSVIDDKGEIIDQKIIFTKDQADIIQVTDIVIPSNVTAGSNLEVRATITDGLGKPAAEIVRAHLALMRPECVPNSYPSSILEFDLGRKSSDPTNYFGQMALPPDFGSGFYQTSFSVFSSASEGYHFPSPAISQINVGNGSIPLTTLFYNVEQLNGTMISKAGGAAQYALGDNIVLKGQVLTDDCHPLQGVRITGDLFGYPTPLIRYNATSDAAGNFTVHFQTYPQLKTDTQYFITLKGEYSNRTLTWNDDYVIFANLQRFHFDVEGKSSTAEVILRNADSRIVSFELDSHSKKITIVLESSGKEQANYGIAIPSELLSGDMIIRKVGSTENPLLLTEKIPFDSVSGPFMDPENDLRHSYFLAANKLDGFTDLSYSDEAGGRATIEITGTSAIPEFGSMSVVVAAASLISITAAIKYFRGGKAK